MPGGPFEHRWRGGRCVVCGYQQAVHDATLLPLCGCPWQVDMATYRPLGKPLSSGTDTARAAQELRALLRGDAPKQAPEHLD